MTATEIDAWVEKMVAEFEEADTVSMELNRFGYKVDGEFHRRVSTFLQGIPKPWLGNWAAKVVAEYAVEHKSAWEDLPTKDAVGLLKQSPWNYRDARGDRGTAVHNAIEAHLHGQELPEFEHEDELLCAQAAQRFLAERGSTPLAVEMSVWNSEVGYAGTFDLWDVWKGEKWLLDWKTSKDVYKENAVQLAAYRNATHAVVNKEVTNGKGKGEYWTGKIIKWGPQMVDRMGVVHVTPEGCVLHEVKYSERLWRIFRAAAFIKMWQLDTDDFAGKTPREVVFEEPITIPRERKP